MCDDSAMGKDKNKTISLRTHKSLRVMSRTSKGLIELLMHGHHASLYLHKNELYIWIPPTLNCINIARKMLIEVEKKILNEIKDKENVWFMYERHAVALTRQEKWKRVSECVSYIVQRKKMRNAWKAMQLMPFVGDDISSLIFFSTFVLRTFITSSSR